MGKTGGRGPVVQGDVNEVLSFQRLPNREHSCDAVLDSHRQQTK